MKVECHLKAEGQNKILNRLQFNIKMKEHDGKVRAIALILQMVTQNMLRTHKGKQVFSGEKIRICD